MGVTINILDEFGVQTGVVRGVSVVGPAKGYRNLRFTPRGACINKIGQAQFDLPMTVRNNYPLVAGTFIRLVDSVYGDQGVYCVTDKSETIAADGHWATFTCFDLVEELVWQTVPGFTAALSETTEATANRLLTINTEVAWTAKNIDGTDGFAGVGYSADAVNIEQAVSKLFQDRFYHWRRGAINPLPAPAPHPRNTPPAYPPPPAPPLPNERLLEFGLFGRPTGIRLVRPSARPAAMSTPYVRAILPGGLQFKTDLTGADNCIIPTGGGQGLAQLTLRSLYNATQEQAVPGTNWWVSGPTALPVKRGTQGGIDPAYPIYRRLRYDGKGVDGYKYFLADTASIANLKRQHWLDYPRADIGTISNAAADVQGAALNLYSVTYAYLKWHSVLNSALSVVTNGNSHNVGIGGDTVRVIYREVVGGVTTIDLNDDYYVLDCVRAVSDANGSYTDTWTISSVGRDASSDVSVATGIATAITQLRNEVAAYPQERDIHYDQPVSAQSPVSVVINLNSGVQEVLQALFTVQLLPIYSTVSGGTVAGHAHDVDIPALAIAAVTPATDEKAANTAYGNQFGHNNPDNILAPKSGTVTDGIGVNKTGTTTDGIGVTNSGSFIDGLTVSKSGGVSQQGGLGSQHWHNVPIFNQGADPSGGKQTLWFNYASQTIGNNSGDNGGKAATGSQTLGTNDLQHGHGDTISANRGGSLTDTKSAGKSGTVTDGIGVNKSGTTTDGITIGKTGGVSAYGGNVPGTIFPGGTGLQTIPLVTKTSTTVAPGWTPVYGIYNDPAGRASGVTVSINGVVVVPAFSDPVKTLDLSAYITGQQPITLVFASATLGRLVIDGVVRTLVTTYALS